MKMKLIAAALWLGVAGWLVLSDEQVSHKVGIIVAGTGAGVVQMRSTKKKAADQAAAWHSAKRSS